MCDGLQYVEQCKVITSRSVGSAVLSMLTLGQSLVITPPAAFKLQHNFDEWGVTRSSMRKITSKQHRLGYRCNSILFGGTKIIMNLKRFIASIANDNWDLNDEGSASLPADS